MTTNSCDNRDVALEEMRILQAIVARHEDHAFKIRGVMYALLTAMAIPLFAEKRMLTGKPFLLLSALIVLLFLCMELVHRAIARMAMRRSSNVEGIIRRNDEYDGPFISESFRQSMLVSTMIGEATLPFVSIHYGALLIIVIVISLIGW